MGSPYQSKSASGYNSSPPPDDGTTTSTNKITWAGIKTKLADSIKTLADAINSALRTALNVSPSTTSVNYTTAVTDHLTTIECTGTITISLGDAVTMAADSMGYSVTVLNKGTGVVTVGVATNTNKLNGNTNGTMALASGQSAIFTVAQSGVDYEVLAVAGFAPIVLTGAAGTNTATAAAPGSVRSLFTGMIVSFTPANTNSGATTLNITPAGGSALTAINVFADGAACSGSELKASVPYLLQYDGTQFNILGRRFKQQTRQVFTSGSGTYTTPAGATRINVRLVGGGGGGGAQATNAGATGGNTTFSTLTGSGGVGGTAQGASGAGGAGGAASGGDFNIPGGTGQSGESANVAGVHPQGGAGAGGPWGGAGGGGVDSAGAAASTNSGAGGGGGGGSSASSSGAGGGAGGYAEKLIVAPSATYSYGVGALGAGGAAGTAAGGNGAAGIIIVDEWYD